MDNYLFIGMFLCNTNLFTMCNTNLLLLFVHTDIPTVYLFPHFIKRVTSLYVSLSFAVTQALISLVDHSIVVPQKQTSV